MLTNESYNLFMLIHVCSWTHLSLYISYIYTYIHYHSNRSDFIHVSASRLLQLETWCWSSQAYFPAPPWRTEVNVGPLLSRLWITVEMPQISDLGVSNKISHHLPLFPHPPCANPLSNSCFQGQKSMDVANFETHPPESTQSSSKKQNNNIFPPPPNATFLGTWHKVAICDPHSWSARSKAWPHHWNVAFCPCPSTSWE